MPARRATSAMVAWDLLTQPDPQTLDLAQYEKLLFRAAHTILEPLGVTLAQLVEAVKDGVRSTPLPLSYRSSIPAGAGIFARGVVAPAMGEPCLPAPDPR